MVDTRPEVEYGICALPKTISPPPSTQSLMSSLIFPDFPLSKILASPTSLPESDEVVFICRRGQDSQVAAAHLAKSGRAKVVDVIGGLEAWSREIDPSFPTY